MMHLAGSGERPRGAGPLSLIPRLVALAFAVIQLILVARILLDLGIVPAEWGISTQITDWSDALAAPVRGLGGGLDGLFGTWGIPGFSAGEGLNPVMVAALAGWTIVEFFVIRVANKFASV